MLEILLTVAVVGLLVWLVTKFVPMPEPFPQIIIAVAAIGTVLWILGYLGLIPMPARLR